MAIDYESTIGKVRAMTGDTDEAAFLMSDAELNAILSVSSVAFDLTVADVLDVMATKHAAIMQKIKTLDLQTDGPAVSKELRERAKAIRERYDIQTGGSTGSGDFDIVAMTMWPDWTIY